MATFLVAIGYLVGSIPTGVLIARLAGVDVRRVGSGNIGATNVTRSAGLRPGLFTLLGDTLKGALPILLARWLHASEGVEAAVGAAAVAGHVFPVTLGFRGGKGVATALGVLGVLAPVVAGAVLVAFAAVVVASRWVSAGSLVAAGLAPVLLALLGHPRVHVLTMCGISLLILVRHRANIGRLLAGTEPKLGLPVD